MLSRSEGNLLAAITLFAGRQRLTTITAEVFTSIAIRPHFMTTKFPNLLFSMLTKAAKAKQALLMCANDSMGMNAIKMQSFLVRDRDTDGQEIWKV